MRWITTAQAAAQLGIAQTTVRTMVYRGHLCGRKNGKQVLITQLSVDTYAELRHSGYSVSWTSNKPVFRRWQPVPAPEPTYDCEAL